MKGMIKISVIVFTYNQETTIRQTLDSILAQKGDFVLELVLGEDCSKDNTYKVCYDYAQKYPDIIKLLPNTHNLGIMANFARVAKACTGEYVGICAGDDYWCDQHKLQKQLDYFRSHPDVGVVSTSGYRNYVLRDEMVPGIAPLRPIEDGNIKQFYFSKDYPGGVYAMPLTLLIKRDLFKYIDLDEYIRRGFPVEDFPMQAVLAHRTKWGHINDLCVVYRIYKESATFISFDHPKYMQYHRGLAEIRRYLNELFPEDACFTEEELQEQVFYKEFLLYLHRMEYKQAKKLIENAGAISDMPKVRHAKRFTKTWLHFIVAHYIKERVYRKDLRKRVQE